MSALKPAGNIEAGVYSRPLRSGCSTQTQCPAQQRCCTCYEAAIVVYSVCSLMCEKEFTLQRELML